MYDIVIPVTFAKANEPVSGVARGRKMTHEVEPVSKAMPVVAKGPAKKAPTLARTGKKPMKAALVPNPAGFSQTPGATMVSKHLSEISKFVSTAERKALAKKPKKKGGFVLAGGKFPIPDKRHIGIAESMEHDAPASEHPAIDAEIAQAKKYYGVSKLRERRIANRKSAQVSKSARYYDPEDKRQRRLGYEAAGSTFGGAALIRSGKKGIDRDTENLGEGAKKVLRRRPVKMKGSSEFKEAISDVERTRVAHGKFVTRGEAGKIGAGIGLLGAAGALMADHHKRRYL